MGIVGIDLIRFEDRLTDVYEGYEIDLPINC